MRYSENDRDAFRLLSQDDNSIHVGDKAIAYGLHVLAMAMSALIEDGDLLVTLNVQYKKPIPVGADMDIRVLDGDGLRRQVGVYLDDEQAVLVDAVMVKRKWFSIR